MRKTSWDSLKAFAIELVRKKTKAEQKKSEPSLKAFVVQLVIFTALVVSYFFLVLSFFSHWLEELFDQNKLVYALVAWALIVTQALVLEVVAAALLKVVESKID
jgi:O-antigen/teichoic acid export membrane protein